MTTPSSQERLLHLLKKTWLIRLVNVALVAWLCWLIADAVLNLSAKPESAEPEPAAVVAVHEPPAAAQSTGEIADWDLFGTAEEQAAETVQPAIIDAPETRLDLHLKGIVATDDRTQGYAIIEKPQSDEQHFAVNDSVFGLATLKEIYIDRVILQRNGRYETLRLPIEFMAADPFLERERKQEARRIVTDFRQKLLARDGMALIKMFGFEETYRNGRFMGFTVKIAGEDGARMLEVLGVEEGDVITAVNGKRFSESLEAIQSLSMLKDATEVDVEIDRKGVPMFFHFDFDQLAGASGGETQAAGVDSGDAADEPRANATH